MAMASATSTARTRRVAARRSIVASWFTDVLEVSSSPHHPRTSGWDRWHDRARSGRARFEVEHHLDVLRFLGQRLRPVSGGDSAGDEPVEPRALGVGERGDGREVVAAVRVDGAEDDVVLEDEAAVEGGRVELDGSGAGGDPGEADDPGAGRVGHGVEHDGASTGALDDDVGSRAGVADSAGVVAG